MHVGDYEEPAACGRLHNDYDSELHHVLIAREGLVNMSQALHKHLYRSSTMNNRALLVSLNSAPYPRVTAFPTLYNGDALPRP